MPNIFFSVLVCLALSACTAAPSYTGAGHQLPPCGSLPNCVNSDSGQGRQAIAPIQATPVQWQALQRRIAEQKSWTIVEKHDDFVQFTAISATFKFRDDVQLLYKPQQALLHVRSSSRLGISDMGANRQRMELLRTIVMGTR